MGLVKEEEVTKRESKKKQKDNNSSSSSSEKLPRNITDELKNTDSNLQKSEISSKVPPKDVHSLRMKKKEGYVSPNLNPLHTPNKMIFLKIP